MTKDIILIVGGGGMAGIFSSGVLKAFEDDAIAGRIHSVYAVSVGAFTAARLLVRESELGSRTFYTRFNTDRFMHGHFVRYFFQVLKRKRSPDARVDDIFDFDYFTEIALHSEYKIDMVKLVASTTPFYVKVFNRSNKCNQYLLVKEPYTYDAIMASASVTPLVARKVFVNGEECFDGDTVPSDIDMDIVRNNPGKRIVRIEDSKPSLLGDFNPFVLFVIYTLLRSMQGSEIANRYFKNFFKRPFWRRNFRKQDNVIIVESDKPISIFATDADLLKRAYAEGLRKGSELVARLSRYDMA